MVGAAEFARGDFLMEWGVSDMLASMQVLRRNLHWIKCIFQAKLFINKTIGELLFDGYDDEVMKVADAVQQSDNESMDDFEFEYDYDEYADEEKSQNNEKVITLPPMDKFGWFYEVCL